jgi:hypothetical protein
MPKTPKRDRGTWSWPSGGIPRKHRHTLVTMSGGHKTATTHTLGFGRKARSVKTSRSINGKRYLLRGANTTKAAAQRLAADCRSRGSYACVTGGRGHWYTWERAARSGGRVWETKPGSKPSTAWRAVAAISSRGR